MSDTRTTRPIPAIFGFADTHLTAGERSFFHDANPLGFILFKRNCATPEQVTWLIKELRQCVGREDAPVLIDQEGGRVSRLTAPQWTQYPPARAFGTMYERDPDWGAEAMQLYARLVANDLAKLGITVNCAPVLDLFIEGATQALGDRAFSRTPAVVAALARTCAETFLANGILPVIKHLPGHGRLVVDPHLTLPRIDTPRPELESDDFIPFLLLKDLPVGMNSHAIFTALDANRPASLSPIVHQEIIRDVIGFDGLLLSDDLCMKALAGTPDDLARRALEAGSDVVLHCNGELGEMISLAHALEPMNAESWARWTYAKDMVKPASPAYDPREDSARLDVLLGGLAYHSEKVA